MSPSSTGHGVSMIPNIHPLTRYCERHSRGREFRIFNVNQIQVSMAQLGNVAIPRPDGDGEEERDGKRKRDWVTTAPDPEK